MKIANQIVFLIFCLMGFLFSCNKEEVTRSEITQHDDPLISTGNLLENGNWNDPHVFRENAQFVMYASASQAFDENVKIYRLQSENGVTWERNPAEPIFQKSQDTSAWDSKSVETPSVVYYQNEYHLFYTGYKTTFSDSKGFKIGHATSSDGRVWKRDDTFILEPSAPEEAPNLDFNQFVVAEPGAVVFAGKLYLYFTALGANADVGTTLQVIGLIMFDGSNWSDPIAVLEPKQTVHPRAQYLGYSTPAGLVKDGQVHLYFDVVMDNPWRQAALYHAVSDDGVINWQLDEEAILERSDYDWTEEEIRSPSAVLFEDKTYLYFAGHSGLDLSIGLHILE